MKRSIAFLQSPSWSRGKLPLSGGVVLNFFWKFMPDIMILQEVNQETLCKINIDIRCKCHSNDTKKWCAFYLSVQKSVTKKYKIIYVSADRRGLVVGFLWLWCLTIQPVLVLGQSSCKLELIGKCLCIRRGRETGFLILNFLFLVTREREENRVLSLSALSLHSYGKG